MAAGTYPKQVNQDAIDVPTETKTPATVFATGMWATTYQKELAKLAANPNFELANHTWNHDAWTKTCYGLPYIGSDQAKHESLQQTNRAITQATGKAVAYVRMPGLCQNHSDVKLMASEGLAVGQHGRADHGCVRNKPERSGQVNAEAGQAGIDPALCTSTAHQMHRSPRRSSGADPRPQGKGPYAGHPQHPAQVGPGARHPET